MEPQQAARQLLSGGAGVVIGVLLSAKPTRTGTEEEEEENERARERVKWAGGGMGGGDGGGEVMKRRGGRTATFVSADGRQAELRGRQREKEGSTEQGGGSRSHERALSAARL